mmetsp:Transcript_10330/g.32747  ORF Transcript_10330/g.32747 Transcript_10330/m.32747 type:complete len:344 (-) Transcript_10330:42-1073(-)
MVAELVLGLVEHLEDELGGEVLEVRCNVRPELPELVVEPLVAFVVVLQPELVVGVDHDPEALAERVLHRVRHAVHLLAPRPHVVPPGDGDADVLEARGREAVDVGLVVVLPVAVALVLELLPKVYARPHGLDDLHGRGPVPRHLSLALLGGRGGLGGGARRHHRLRRSRRWRAAAARNPPALAPLALPVLRVAPIVVTAGAAVPRAAGGHPAAFALTAVRLLRVAPRVPAAGASSPGAAAPPRRRRHLGKHLGRLLLVVPHGGFALINEGGPGVASPLQQARARRLLLRPQLPGLLQIGDGLLADRQREAHQRRQDRSGEGAVTHHGTRGKCGRRCRRCVYGR